MAQEQTDQTGERTFEPTPMRLADARKRGQVARSADLTAAVAGLAALLVLTLLGPGLLREMTSMTAAMLDGRNAALSPADENLGGTIKQAAGGAIVRVAGIAAAIAGLIAVAAFAQVGPLLASEQVKADWDRVSISAGWRRLMSSRALVRAVLAIVKIAAVVAVVWFSAEPMLKRILAAPRLTTSMMVSEAGNLAGAVLLRGALCLLVLGLVDYVYQRFQHRRDLRMTRREWLEDMKNAESGGATRSRRRQRARKVTVRRITDGVSSVGTVEAGRNDVPGVKADENNA